MIAKIIRDSFLKSMGSVLDMLRLSDIGERQLRQMEISIKNLFNENLVSLFSSLEKEGLIKKCHCLERILEGKAKQLSSDRMKKLYLEKENCPDCGGSGYLDCREEGNE